MPATCGVSMMVYIIPMLLGRTYDMQQDKVGIDIFDKADIDGAKRHPIMNPSVSSVYMTIEKSVEKRDFIGISGELALKVSAGLVDIRGAGEYLKDASKAEKSIEILIKMTFNSLIQEISLDAKPLKFWELLKKESVGTHVVTSLTYGGEVYASVNFIAHKAEDLQSIRAEVSASIAKSGAFDISAAGKLESLSQNISSKAKMEIDYYATVPLESVPTTIEGLRTLVNHFKEQVDKINNGTGVAICAGMTPLSHFKEDFKFVKNRELLNCLEEFNYKFDNLREAKSSLRGLVSSFSFIVPEDYLKQVIDFSDRLTKTLMVFHKVIGDMDLQQGSGQLEPALEAFDSNSDVMGDDRYTTEIKRLIKKQVITGDVSLRRKVQRFPPPCSSTDDPYTLRGTYVRWGKRTCGPKANLLYIGFMSSVTHEGIGAGTEYQCLPENPVFSKDPDVTGLRDIGSKLSAVRYKSLSVFNAGGKGVEEKVASCTVCETPMRLSIEVFPATSACPEDWVEEYAGFLVSSQGTYWGRTEHICLDYDPDTYPSSSAVNSIEPHVFPVKMGEEGGKKKRASSAASSVPCAVCSK